MKKSRIISVLLSILMVLTFTIVASAETINVKPSDKSIANFQVYSTSFEWGEAVTSITIDMGQAVIASKVKLDTFKVEATDPKDGLTARKITSVKVEGNKITLNFEATAVIGKVQAVGTQYVITQKNPVVNNGDFVKTFVQLPGVINPAIDAFTAGSVAGINYRLFSPAKTNKPLPLVVWLHGAGERGTDNRIQIAANLVTNWATPESQAYFGKNGAYILAVQSPGWHDPSKVMAAIEEVIGKSNVDMNRIYVGGCSMGGAGTISMITAYPEFFAAAFPICAAAEFTEDAADALADADMPVYLIHSIDDNTVPVSLSLYNYNVLKDAGAKVFMTLFNHVDFNFSSGEDVSWILPYLGHWSWVYVHKNFDCLGNDYDGQQYHAGNYSAEYPLKPTPTTYTATSIAPHDLGYANFFSWLAAQSK